MVYESAVDGLRPIRITTDYTEMADGSVLMECGRTRVLVTAMIQEGVPPFLQGRGSGWLTAEYAMLPGATPTRKARDGVKKDGRSVEIQRLIGRSLRACCDLTRLGERTVYIDCDVLQADGGTRTASITGAFVALCLAVHKHLEAGTLVDSPIVQSVAAVSVGIVDDQPTLDLCYQQDARAQVDMNVVMTRDREGAFAYAEVQGTGERRAYTRSELDTMLAQAERGIERLMEAQRQALGDRADVIGRKPRLAIATGNFGKLREIRAILGERYDVRSMRELGVTLDVEETGETFAENAILKAEALMERTGCATLADDSGLAVDALNGRPGVYSARYCGVHGDDAANNEKLLHDLADVPAPRTGRFVCAVALARPGRATVVTTGTCEGEILDAPRGVDGFGYDPLFLSADLGVTFAEADAVQKNGVSHRARAIEALKQVLEAERA